MSLNSKKSWHPGKAINKARVLKLEQDRDAQLRRAEELRAEIEEERELSTLRSNATNNSSANDQDQAMSRVSWIYSAESPRFQTREKTMDTSHIRPRVDTRDSTFSAKSRRSSNQVAQTDAQKESRLDFADPFARIMRASESEKLSHTGPNRGLRSGPNRNYRSRGRGRARGSGIRQSGFDRFSDSRNRSRENK